jgi:putative peptidoglycan lipid II flippase
VFLALGDVVAAALLQTGRFRYADAVYVWAILAGSAVGLLATTFGRLYASTYYALRDTRTPLRYAVVHVAIATVLGYVLAVPVTRWAGLPASWGAAGLTIAASVAAWVELLLLRRRLNARIGVTGIAPAYLAKLWTAAAAAAGVAWGAKLAGPVWHPAAAAALILGVFGVTFLVLCLVFRLPEATSALAGAFKRLQR